MKRDEEEKYDKDQRERKTALQFLQEDKNTRYSGWGDGNTSGSAWEQGGLILLQAEYFDFV